MCGPRHERPHTPSCYFLTYIPIEGFHPSSDRGEIGVVRDHPELALFLCLAAGYLVGKLRVGPVTPGGICGTLIVSLLIGTRHVSVNDNVKTIFFALFIFSLGYMAGPRIFANLNRNSLRFFALCPIELVCVLGIA